MACEVRTYPGHGSLQRLGCPNMSHVWVIVESSTNHVQIGLNWTASANHYILIYTWMTKVQLKLDGDQLNTLFIPKTPNTQDKKCSSWKYYKDCQHLSPFSGSVSF